MSTCAGEAPFCGANTGAASVNNVCTSHATSSVTPRSRCGAVMARTQPRPPSVVAEPPRHTTIFFAPRSSAWSISSPVPVVVAAIASLPSAPPTSVSPDARRHLDDRHAPVEAPLGLHRVAERTGDGARAVRATECLERAFATVGHRLLDALVTELPAGMADGRSHLRGAGGALELVDRSQHSHSGQANCDGTSRAGPLQCWSSALKSRPSW